MLSCVSEPTMTALTFHQVSHFYPFNLLVGGNDHLRDPLSVVDHKFILRQVDQNDFNLSPVVCIDGTR